jgi:DNA-binding NarL/FixJ family response regulator
LRQHTAVLLDGDPLWLNAVEAVVSEKGVAVVGKETEGAAALELVERLEPDLLVAEVRRPGAADGIACVRAARGLVPQLEAIALSACEKPAAIAAAFDAGATICVIKTTHPDDAVQAIRHALDHTIIPSASGRSQRQVARLRSKDGYSFLTDRELDILSLTAAGHSDAKMAEMLWVTEQTVEFRLSNIYRKLDVSNRTEASRWAQAHRVLETSGNPPRPIEPT